MSGPTSSGGSGCEGNDDRKLFGPLTRSPGGSLHIIPPALEAGGIFVGGEASATPPGRDGEGTPMCSAVDGPSDLAFFRCAEELVNRFRGEFVHPDS